MTCTFFGHRDCSLDIVPILREKIIDLIENYGVLRFYVGNNGSFDKIVQSVLKEICSENKHVEFFVVLEKLPRGEEITNSIFPEKLALVHPKFAIDRRNHWMMEKSNFAITYVVRSFGGASKFQKLCKSRGLTVIEI